MAHPPERVFAFLSDLRNHWRLEPHFLELEGMAPEGGRVCMRGPLGISRVAHTRVVKTAPPTTLHGAADVGRGTHASVRWDIAAAGTGSDVTFTALVDSASLLDRILLAAGGRWWLTRVFQRAVERLGTSISER